MTAPGPTEPRDEPGRLHQPVVTTLHSRVRPGDRHAYERLLHDLIGAATGHPGALDATVLRPGPSGRDYIVRFSFASQPELEAWLHSAEYRDRSDAIAPLAERVRAPVRRVGPEAWFDLDNVDAPAPHRMAPLVWLGIFPIALLSSTVFRPALLHLPVLPRVMLSAAVQVVLLTWVIMPTLTRLFRRWLHH
ncbi:antibiotic biosynthesis monooxygenase [Streptacidiphilus sp. P02-A3a]|uniref:antibiotic biosynthesis monooxygenase n=1 Tax=Streptacidiphilus sp. P02-A3a TaxID=2704468 RepID=UPI0015FA9F27|nr:antibiotic biosynthesis monooxygenase [Streptacidiphilus sp. P02-A3a]QMU73056.1 antibiotic biosynthesis monooxygenase [Streptacidiphilus sp. P02-A3a]